MKKLYEYKKIHEGSSAIRIFTNMKPVPFEENCKSSKGNVSHMMADYLKNWYPDLGYESHYNTPMGKEMDKLGKAYFDEYYDLEYIPGNIVARIIYTTFQNPKYREYILLNGLVLVLEKTPKNVYEFVKYKGIYNGLVLKGTDKFISNPTKGFNFSSREYFQDLRKEVINVFGNSSSLLISNFRDKEENMRGIF